MPPAPADRSKARQAHESSTKGGPLVHTKGLPTPSACSKHHFRRGGHSSSRDESRHPQDGHWPSSKELGKPGTLLLECFLVGTRLFFETATVLFSEACLHLRRRKAFPKVFLETCTRQASDAQNRQTESCLHTNALSAQTLAASMFLRKWPILIVVYTLCL